MNDLSLISVEKINAVELYNPGGADDILKKIRDEVKATPIDIATEEGRKACASLAYKVSRSKTLLDEMGKTLTEEWKLKSKAVDSERKKIRDHLDALKEEVRRPLTEWEQRDEKRAAAHQTLIDEIAELGQTVLTGWLVLSVDRMKENQQTVQDSKKRDWEEFANRAKLAIDTAEKIIADSIAQREKHDTDKAELEKFRKAEADRLQKERDEALQREAAETARQAAEAKAEADRQEAEKKARAEAEAAAAQAAAERQAIDEQRQAAEKKAAEAEQARQAAEDKARQDAEKAEADRVAAAAKAEADRQAAAAKAEADRQAAEKKAAEDKEKAVEAERKRIAAEQLKEKEAADKREADQKHRAKINNAALGAIVDAMAAAQQAGKEGMDVGMAIVEAIVRGKVPNVKITY